MVQKHKRACDAISRLALILSLVLMVWAPLSRAQDDSALDNAAASEAADAYSLKYREVQQAILLFKSGKADAARTVLAQAAKKHKELPPVDVLMARLYYSAGDTRRAEAALERVATESPEDPEAFILLGDMALRAKRLAFADLAYDRAEQLLKKYEKIEDRKNNLSIRVLAGKASVAESRGKHTDALKHLAAWVKADPRSPLALGSLGRVSFKAKKYDEARAAFTQLSAIAKTAPPPEIAMGRFFSDVGMHDEAVQEMKVAIAKHGNDPRAVLTVADWALANGETALAQQNVAAALKLDPKSSQGRVLSARMARHTGDLTRAEETISELVLLTPNSFSVTDEYARTLASSSDKEKRRAALQHAERNYKEQRKRGRRMSPQAVVTYAWALFQNGDQVRAEAAAQSLPDGSQLDSENGYFVAAIYAGRGKNEIASQMLKALLNNQRPFPMREQAEALLGKLQEEAGS